MCKKVVVSYTSVWRKKKDNKSSTHRPPMTQPLLGSPPLSLSSYIYVINSRVSSVHKSEISVSVVSLGGMTQLGRPQKVHVLKTSSVIENMTQLNGVKYEKH